MSGIDLLAQAVASDYAAKGGAGGGTDLAPLGNCCVGTYTYVTCQGLYDCSAYAKFCCCTSTGVGCSAGYFCGKCSVCMPQIHCPC